MAENEIITVNKENYIRAIGSERPDDLDSYKQPYFRAKGFTNSFVGRTFRDYDTNLSLRADFNSADYEYFRPSERVPREIKEQMYLCHQSYKNIPVVRNTIDMMTDFTISGIRIVHPDKTKQTFLRNWWKFIKGKEVSNKIAKNLYKFAVSPVRRETGKLGVKVKKELSKSLANRNFIELRKNKVFTKNEVGVGYRILSPFSLEPINPELVNIVDVLDYGIVLNPLLAKRVTSLTGPTPEEHRRYPEEYNYGIEKTRLVSQQLQSMKPISINGQQIIPIPPEDLTMLFFKKDDWELWPTPILVSCLSRLASLEKMHLADVAALDGALTQIRVWTLGDIEHGIFPGPAAFAKLSNILDNAGQGVLDLVWGPELKLQTSETQVHQFLGSEKYEQVMAEIHAGLGISQTLSGGSETSNTGFTNNAISIKVLVERMEYVRDIIQEFWQKELKNVQNALGWTKPGKVTFDFPALSDEQAEKRILIELWDRDVISTETLRDTLGREADIEEIRVKKEYRKRISDSKTPNKTSPYHKNNELSYDIMKTILTNGGIFSPTLLKRLDIEDSEQIITEIQNHENEKMKQEQKMKITGKAGEGRPPGSQDKEKRKPKQVNVRKIESATASEQFMENLLFAKESQKKIDSIVKHAYLKSLGKKNLQHLNKEEQLTFERLKFRALSNLKPNTEINDKIIKEAIVKVPEELCQASFKNLVNR
ncbi:MAG: hypothetical protein ACFFG0_41540, partial [Candidatus Thorarchaeota archaeon]